MMSNDTSAERQAAIDKAREVGAELAKTEPRAVRAWFDNIDRIFIELNSGIVMGFPYIQLQGLDNATPQQLAEVEITPSGYGLHWESLDVDLAVPQLVTGIFGNKSWMTELGRQGGKSKSEAKTQAARDNGKRGGRPKKISQVFEDDELLSLRQLCKTEEVAQTRIKNQPSSEILG